MDPDQIALLRQSHAAILPRAAAFGAAFHAHLFDQDPALRSLFPTDADAQARTLMDLIHTLLALLDQPDGLLAHCRELGQRHRGRVADEADYDRIGIALLRTLRDALGARYTEEVEAAWAGAYGEIAEAMIASQRSPRQGGCRADAAGCMASMD